MMDVYSRLKLSLDFSVKKKEKNPAKNGEKKKEKKNPLKKKIPPPPINSRSSQKVTNMACNFCNLKLYSVSFIDKENIILNAIVLFFSV